MMRSCGGDCQTVSTVLVRASTNDIPLKPEYGEHLDDLEANDELHRNKSNSDENISRLSFASIYPSTKVSTPSSLISHLFPLITPSPTKDL